MAQRAARFPHFPFLQFPPKCTTFIISADLSHCSGLLQPAMKTALDTQQASPVVRHLCRKTLWPSPSGSSIINPRSPWALPRGAGCALLRGRDNKGCGAGSRQPREWTKGPATPQRLSGRLLLVPCGAHLLGQRNLQMAMEMDVSGGNGEDEEKSNSTTWDTLICF